MRLTQADGVPDADGGYSLAVRCGDLLFLAGQAPYDEHGSLRRGSVGEQVRLALENLDRVARAAGGSLRDAVRIGVYLRDLADFEEMDAAYQDVLGPRFPARTTIQSNLIDFDVEIDAIVALAPIGA